MNSFLGFWGRQASTVLGWEERRRKILYTLDPTQLVLQFCVCVWERRHTQVRMISYVSYRVCRVCCTGQICALIRCRRFESVNTNRLR
jgi:hypothetical protein